MQRRWRPSTLDSFCGVLWSFGSNLPDKLALWPLSVPLAFVPWYVAATFPFGNWDADPAPAACYDFVDVFRLEGFVCKGAAGTALWAAGPVGGSSGVGREHRHFGGAVFRHWAMVPHGSRASKSGFPGD